MTLDEFIEHLEEARDATSGDLLVVMSRDAEGNGFDMYGDWGGGLYLLDEREFTSYNEDDEELTPDEYNAICLWP